MTIALARPHAQAHTKIHLGCGTIHRPGWLNVDVVPLKAVDVVADLGQPWTFAVAGTVEEIFCKDVLEHQRDPGFFLAECARLLTPGGVLRIQVPHFKNPSAYRVTHLQWFSWSCFACYPEPHDATQTLRVISNRLVLADSRWFAPLHWLINLAPKWYERIGYVSNLHVTFQKRH